MSLKNLLKPNKEKFLLDLALILILLIFVLTIPSLGYQKHFFSAGLSVQAFGIIVSLLLGIIIYYPLACGISFIYNAFIKKRDKYWKKDLVLALMMILLFNPITYSLILKEAMYVNNNIINHPCGIQITGFSSISPVKDAGAGIGEIILNVENQKVDTLDSFIHAMAGKKPGDYVSLQTNLNEYQIKTIENPSNPRDAFLGILIKPQYCKS